MKHTRHRILTRGGRLALALAMMLPACLIARTGDIPASAASGKTYYVAADGSDSNDGLSEGRPLSYNKARTTVYNGGDSIRFRRGDVFYGCFKPITFNTANNNRVDVGAYGSGALPILSNAKIIRSAWTPAENGFYKFDLTAKGSYDGVQDINCNVGFMEDSKGVKHGVRQKDAASCTGTYDFYCDKTYIYVKSPTDPHKALGDLTLATHGSLIEMAANMDIHDLHLQNSGYGITWNRSGKMENASIYDCVMENLGGTIINEKDFTKGGNGVELYHTGSNVTVEKNIFRNIFDVGFTCQGTDPGVWKTIQVRQNVFAYNTQAIEIWCHAQGQKGVNLLDFTDNLCINQGEGWGTEARPNKEVTTDFLAYNYYPSLWRMTIKNNAFYHSGNQGVAYWMHSPTAGTFIKNVTVDSNQFYMPSDSSVVFETSKADSEYKDKHLNLKEWQSFSGKDKNSTLTAIGGNKAKYSAMENLAKTSLDFNAIVAAAKAAGISVNISTSGGTPDSTKAPTPTPAPQKTSAPAGTRPAADRPSANPSKPASSQAVTAGNGTSLEGGTEPDGTGSQSEGAESTENTALASDPGTTQTLSGPSDPAPSSRGWIWAVVIGAIVVLGGAGAAVYFLVLKKKANPAD